MSKRWSKEEIDILQKTYPIYGSDGCTQINRSTHAIRSKARDLNIKRSYGKNTRKYRVSVRLPIHIKYDLKKDDVFLAKLIREISLSQKINKVEKVDLGIWERTPIRLFPNEKEVLVREAKKFKVSVPELIRYKCSTYLKGGDNNGI